MKIRAAYGILREIRKQHRTNKSLDKEYEREEWKADSLVTQLFYGNPYENQPEARDWGWCIDAMRRQHRRNHYNAWAEPRVRVLRSHRTFGSIDLARLAGERVQSDEHSYCLASIDGLANHHFCVAGYHPHDGSPKSVQDMSNEDTEALIIDPWMNVCCKFSDYPVQAKLKLMKWSFKGKRIRRRGTVFNPIDWEFVLPFFTGPLTFEIHEVRLEGNRLRLTKPATQRA